MKTRKNISISANSLETLRDLALMLDGMSHSKIIAISLKVLKNHVINERGKALAEIDKGLIKDLIKLL